MNDQPTDAPNDGGVNGLQPKFIDIDGIRTRYYEYGIENRGSETIVLIHGFNWHRGFGANNWSKNLRGLANSHRVIAFDRLGCGLTDAPDNVEDYVYDSELSHATGFIKEVTDSPVHIAGSSRGGGLSTRVTVEIPDYIKSLTILNSNTLGPPAGDHTYRFNRLVEKSSFEDLTPTDPEYHRYILRMFSYQTDHITQEFCETNAAISRSPKSKKVYEVLIENGQQKSYVDTLREEMAFAKNEIRKGAVDVPVLYIFGRNDITTRLETGIAAFDMFGQTNSNVRLKLFNRCGHLIHREHPAEFNSTLSNHISFNSS